MGWLFPVQERISRFKRDRSSVITESGFQRILELDRAWAIVAESSHGWYPSQNLNRVIDLVANEPDESLLTRIKATYGGAPRHFVYLDPCDEMNEWASLLAQQGYFLGIAMSVLVGPVAPFPLEPKGPVVRPADLESVRHVLSDGGAQELSPTDITATILSSTDTQLFIAELDQEPVAVGAVSEHHGLAALSHASTRPGFRRRGAQTALIRARMNWAAERGCDTAFAETYAFLSSSFDNLERQGLRELYQRQIWRYESDPALRAGLQHTLQGHPEPTPTV